MNPLPPPLKSRMAKRHFCCCAITPARRYRNPSAISAYRQGIERHIGWDIGALSVSRHLSRQLDATLIHQRYSRLVIDCNRAPGIASSIPHLSELTPIPGNIGIDAEHALAREREVFLPYHHAIDDHLGQRQLRELPTAVIAMHSFTPVFKGESRPGRWGCCLTATRSLPICWPSCCVKKGICRWASTNLMQ